jgi:aromatic ring hydroxylase
MFRGEVTTDGKCIVPLNKLSIYNDGDTGTIRLEVIAENTVFIPWERVYKIESSKKVNALVNESTTNKKKIGFVKTKVEAKISNRK